MKCAGTEVSVSPLLCRRDPVIQAPATQSLSNQNSPTEATAALVSLGAKGMAVASLGSEQRHSEY